MNQALSFTQAARTSSDPAHGLYSDHMLAELLALQEEMIAQLCLERLEVVSNADFLTGLIDEHEAAAALLRAQLGNHEVATTNDGVIVITHEGNFDAEHTLSQALPRTSAHPLPSVQTSIDA